MRRPVPIGTEEREAIVRVTSRVGPLQIVEQVHQG